MVCGVYVFFFPKMVSALAARRTLATIMFTMGLVLVLGGLHIIEGSWVPWIIHGLFPLLCASVVWAAHVNEKRWRKLREIVIEAESRLDQ